MHRPTPSELAIDATPLIDFLTREESVVMIQYWRCRFQFSRGNKMRMNIRCRIVVSSVFLFTWSCSGVGYQSRLVQIRPEMGPLGSHRAMAVHQGAILEEFCLKSPGTPVEVRLWWEIETNGHTSESKPIICQSKDARQAASCIINGVFGTIVQPGDRLATVQDWEGNYAYLNAPRDVRIVGTGQSICDGIGGTFSMDEPISIEKSILSCTYPIVLSNSPADLTSDENAGDRKTLVIRLIASITESSDRESPSSGP